MVNLAWILGLSLSASLPLAKFEPTLYAAKAPREAPSGLVVDLVGFENDEGQFVVNVFAGEQGFPEDTHNAVRTLVGDIVGRTASVRVDDLPPGTYAIAVLHDVDLDGEVDKNFLGIPREAYGASNDARRKLGPPRFADASFRFDGARHLRITVK